MEDNAVKQLAGRMKNKGKYNFEFIQFSTGLNLGHEEAATLFLFIGYFN